jgi:PAS domain S-box-containing protein
LASVGAGVALRFALGSVLGTSVPYVTLYPAVVCAATMGGLGPGLLATALSLGTVFFLVPPLHPAGLTGDVVRAALFGVFSVAFSAFSEALRRAHAQSERDRELLHITLSSIGDAVISTDAGGKITFLNSVAEELTGWNRAEAAGKAIAEVFVVRNEMTGLAAEIPVDKVIREGIVVSLANHTVLRNKDGRDIPIEDSAAPIRGGDQQLLGAVLVFRDVTARRESEAALKKSEERLKLALEAGRIGVWDWDVVPDRVAWSERVYEIYGVEPGGFGGRAADFSALVHRDDRERVNAAVRASLETDVPFEVEFRAVHPRKGVIWIANSGVVHRNQKGEPVRMLGSVTDISEQKESEAKLRQQWQTFDTALSNTPDFNYVFDLEGRFTYVNRARLIRFQRTYEDVIGKNFHDLGYPTELAARFLREIRWVVDTQQTYRGESPMTWPSGETREYEYIFVPVISPDGVVEAVVGTTHDITELKIVQERLRASEERLTLALEAGGGIGTWDWDVVNDRAYVNRRFAELYSIDPEVAPSGVPVAEFLKAIHPEDLERVQQQLQTALNTGGAFDGEYRVVQTDGPVRWVYGRGSCRLNETGQPVRFSGVLFEISERKRAEQALKESEVRLRAIYDGMYEYMGVLSLEGKVLDCNPASLRFANNTLQDVVGQPFWETPWFIATPGMPERVRQAVAAVASGESVRTEMTLIRPSGEARIFDFSMNPLRNERGEVVMMVPEGRDITDQKRAEEELKRSNNELTRVNRELEEFAFVASHDLQEPLRMVNIYTQLILSDRGPNQADAAQYARYVRDGVERMEGLIHDLLTFSRAVHSDQSPAGTADLSAALEEATSVLKNRIDESGCIVQSGSLPLVRGDASQMAHVFQNLLSNAMKYSKQGIPPAIHVSAARDGNFWTVSIRDNGIGFEQRYAERIFGLFKRLHKGEYPGTGLGLAICKRIIERSGGRIWAEGRPGDGATFYFSLSGAE